MALLTVGIGECKVSNDPADTLITYALGSCIALMLYDPLARVGGLLHYMLPESGIDAEKATQRPFLFADTGIPLLLESAYRMGAVKSRIRLTAAGGAQMLDQNGMFQIGQRNHVALRTILRKTGVIVHREEIGGTDSRTVRLDVDSGRVQVTASGAGAT